MSEYVHPILGPSLWRADGEYFVYVLIDPRNDAIRYVGITMRPMERINGHEAERFYCAPKSMWLRDIFKARRRPILHVVERGIYEKQHARRREAWWTRKLLADGHDLLNQERFNTKYLERMGA